jgi:GNAT superfamily N-acetyltransferase
MILRQYRKQDDEENLITLLEDEGEEWACYWKEDVVDKYRTALANSITYVAYEDDILCGYSRSLDDCGFYIYVCDLLVRRDRRGNGIGRELMECIYKDYPDQIVFVMSDVDEYYKKLGYRREGSVYQVTNRNGQRQSE